MHRTLVLALALLVSVPLAHAGDLIDGSNPRQILEVFNDYDSAELEKDKNGDPKIVGRIGDDNLAVFFYGCTDGKNCTDIQLWNSWSGYTVTPAQINEWNRKNRFGKAYLENGKPNIKMQINLRHGISRKNLDDTIHIWKFALVGFKQSVLLAHASEPNDGSNPQQLGELIDADNPRQILEIFKGYGSAELEKDKFGDPKIVGHIEDNYFTVFFYGCTDGKNCTDLLLWNGWSGYTVTPAQINEWNRKKRFSKAYLEDNDPTIEMPINLRHGISRKNLDDTIDRWNLVVREFKQGVLHAAAPAKAP